MTSQSAGLMILVAGPYRSGTGDHPDKMAANVRAMEAYALPLFRAGHVPVVGEWFALPLVVLVCVLGAWEALVRALEVPAFIVPPPSAVVRTFVGGVLGGTYFLHLAVTAAETVLGFLAGSALGLFLGILIVVFPTLERILYPYVVALQTIPIESRKFVISTWLPTWK